MEVLLPYLNLAQIIVSMLLIVLVLLQIRGSGFASGYSSDSSIYRTRRGVEKTLFQLTIGVGVIFVVLSIVSVLVPRFSAT